MPIEFIRNVPLWVWPLLAALLALGWSLSRDRTISIGRAMIAPAILVPLSAYGVWSSFGLEEIAFKAWGLGLLVATLLNIAVFRTPRSVEGTADGRLAIGGSWLPMVLILVEFSSRFILGTTRALAPHLTTNDAFIAVISVVIGACGGMFLGQALWIIGRHRQISRPLVAKAQSPSKH